VIFIPPGHFSSVILQRGIIIIDMPAGAAPGVPIIPADPAIPIPGMPIPGRSVIIPVVMDPLLLSSRVGLAGAPVHPRPRSVAILLASSLSFKISSNKFACHHDQENDHHADSDEGPRPMGEDLPGADAEQATAERFRPFLRDFRLRKYDQIDKVCREY